MSEADQPVLQGPGRRGRGPAQRRVRGEDGVEIALLEWSGSGPLVLLHHATGFCAGLWEPVVGALGELHAVALDARGHGASSKPSDEGAYRWSGFVADAVRVAETLASERPGSRIALGVGHSLGGATLLAAAAERPGLFERLLLLDPVVLAPRPALDPDQPRRSGGLAAAARRRRDVFASRDAARARWARHRFFRAWDPRALESYLRWGLRERSSGEVELSCPKRIEAAVFAASGTLDLYGLAPRIEIPVEIVWARRGDFPRPVYEGLADRLPHARVLEVDMGHLIPMEQPDWVAEAIRERVSGTPAGR